MGQLKYPCPRTDNEYGLQIRSSMHEIDPVCSISFKYQQNFQAYGIYDHRRAYCWMVDYKGIVDALRSIIRQQEDGKRQQGGHGRHQVHYHCREGREVGNKQCLTDSNSKSANASNKRFKSHIPETASNIRRNNNSSKTTILPGRYY